MSKSRHYSDAERAEAVIKLAVNKYNYQKTADAVGVPIRTLRRWDKSIPKKGVGDLLERAIQRLLMALPEKMSGKDWAITLGILMDKWFLMQGEPTERTESIVHGYKDCTDDEKQAVVERARELLAGVSVGGFDEGDSSGETPTNGDVPG